jgi:hypothetical protein
VSALVVKVLVAAATTASALDFTSATVVAAASTAWIAVRMAAALSVVMSTAATAAV